ncbi:MAG TPA: hypothetical protein DCQ37_20020 [Desulfobacteraceae bacterium]|jgi:hypothetical protein|nr:hypothetical protein [Desulfobacteraceae bacterium]
MIKKKIVFCEQVSFLSEIEKKIHTSCQKNSSPSYMVCNGENDETSCPSIYPGMQSLKNKLFDKLSIL